MSILSLAVTQAVETGHMIRQAIAAAAEDKLRGAVALVFGYGAASGSGCGIGGR